SRRPPSPSQANRAGLATGLAEAGARRASRKLAAVVEPWSVGAAGERRPDKALRVLVAVAHGPAGSASLQRGHARPGAAAPCTLQLLRRRGGGDGTDPATTTLLRSSPPSPLPTLPPRTSESTTTTARGPSPDLLQRRLELRAASALAGLAGAGCAMGPWLRL
ncbi:unnamed protein product, partial [Urochloa humidicola]